MKRSLFWIGLMSIGLMGTAQQVTAQTIVPDQTLNTIVTPNTNRFVITGGTSVGNHLFHSFQEFSIPTGRSAIFDQAGNIQTIFSRVTGGTASNIDGAIAVNGTANLFLINPNGILLGANAQLNIGGSFVGTTANRIRFQDGTEFGAETPTLLTMSAPVGLQFGTTPGAIQVRSRLQVPAGQLIALLGGAIEFDNGQIAAPDGRIELGSLAANSSIDLIGSTVRYAPNAAFQSIRMGNGSSIDVSGNSGGNIQVRGQHLTLTEGSSIVSRTFGAGTGGVIDVKTSDSIAISGAGAGDLADVTKASEFVQNLGTSVPRFSGIYSTVMPGATGRGSNVQVETQQLELNNGIGRFDLSTFLSNSTINSMTLGAGQGGNVTVKADRLYISEQATLYTLSGLWLDKTDTGNAGNLTIDARSVIVRDGGLLTATTEGDGNAGNLTIRATEKIHLEATPQNFTTVIESTSYGKGRAGNLTLETGSLSILNGGRLASSSDTSGDAGNITIESPIILGLEDSNIAANAIEGRGGNISITTQGIIGLQFRDRLTPENDITATSEIGIDGTVQVNTIGVNPNSGLIQLPIDPTDSTQQIAEGCTANQNSRFIITGRGGVPSDPSQGVGRTRTWSDLRSMNKTEPVLVEATTWKRDRTGKVQLIANLEC
ncbi:hypothetical protein LEP3755_06960 [Leptolyngbya sp. NIES-3755]|nr:hypothetical protein LEP3755_06960 [Leptolyngbya sp. NIES-3755]